MKYFIYFGGGGGNRTRVQRRRIQKDYMLSRYINLRSEITYRQVIIDPSPFRFTLLHGRPEGLSRFYDAMLDSKLAESPDDVAALSCQCVLVRVCSYV